MASEILERVRARDGHETEFLQAVEEVMHSLEPVLKKHPEYTDALARLVEPERMFMFRVPWVDDKGKQHVNRGFRVQFNSAIGPYKGGLRFHPSVNLSIIKFLGFEQIFKNSLTTLPMGGGKGGSDFDPKGKSDVEVMRFCQSFMTELSRHIGATTDVPAGDIGVGGREIGFLYGQFKRLRNTFEGVLTGKAPEYGGSLIRPEATGYGEVYFAQNAFEHTGGSLKGKRCAVSGSGNVAQFCVEKILDLGGVPVSVSDSRGTVVQADGITRADLAEIMTLKNVTRGSLDAYAAAAPGKRVYHPGARPWRLVKVDVAFPSATQNELDGGDATALADGGCLGVFEGANMPCTSDAIKTLHARKVIYGPGKAANAGGVAVSGLEMAQNSMHVNWTREEVDERLRHIMKSIFTQCVTAAEEVEGKGSMNLQMGANVAGFLKVAKAMTAQGCV